MLKKTLSLKLVSARLGMFAALILSVGGIVVGADPIKFSTIASAKEMAEEISAKVALVEKSLADEATYNKDKKKTLPREAGTIAVLAQAVAEHDEDSDLKKTAPDVREGAIALAKAGSYDDAKKALEAIKGAVGGKSNGAKPEAEWNKLLDMDSMMAEVQSRNSKLSRLKRKFPEDTTEAVRHAQVLALLAVPMAADTHEVKDASKTGDWVAQAKAMQEAMNQTAAALKAKDADAFKKAFADAAQSCNKCHEQFRDH